jgi:hypothetical protein
VANGAETVGTLPQGCIAFAASTEEGKRNMANLVKRRPGPPCFLPSNAQEAYLYRFDGEVRLELPEGVSLLRAGDSVHLPMGEDFRPDAYHTKSVNDLPTFACQNPQSVMLPVVATPLAAYSLRGQATTFEESMVEATPILGDLCLAGQSTVWYAAPNAGKTLIALKLLVEAIRGQRIAPGNAYYINADDGNEGFATKLRILDDLGAHTLAPGFAGFKAADLAGLLREMAETNTAAGTIIIVDTLKKFADLMHKKEASAFGDAARQYVMRGGTLLGLAHVNKNPGANGKPSYAGVADIVQDADAAYMMSALEDVGDGQERVVEFQTFKLRGPGVGKVAYAYAADAGLSYHERLASVRVVDPKLFEEFERFQAEKSDAHILVAIASCISDGIVQKMALAKAAAGRAHVSERAVIRALEAYTGDDLEKDRWTYVVRERGAKVFELLAKPKPTEKPASD